MSIKQDCWNLQTSKAIWLRCDITLSFLIDSAGHYLFHELRLPWHSMLHSLPPSESALMKETSIGNSRYLAT